MRKKIIKIPDWLFVSLFAAMRATYSAALEAFVCWGLTELLFRHSLLDVEISYFAWFGLWYIIGFIVAFVQYWRIFKDC